MTAVTTTIISFLPVFTMQAAEGKLFKPLAYTKTFALVASVIVALTIIPPFAHILFTRKIGSDFARKLSGVLMIAVGVLAVIKMSPWIGMGLIVWGLYTTLQDRLPLWVTSRGTYLVNYVAVIMVGLILTEHWLPLGPDKGFILNLIFVAMLIRGLLFAFGMLSRFYKRILAVCLEHKLLFLSLPLALIIFGQVLAASA